MNTPETGVVQVAPRRGIEFKRFGARDGRPLVYAHGLPGSANEAAIADDFGKEHGLDIIGISRPGIGRSDFQTNRTMGHWPDDVQRVADMLGLQEFDLMGMSGGGPYALVCAHQLHNRALSTSIVASPSEFASTRLLDGMARRDKFFLWLAKYVPIAARAILEYKAHCERSNPGSFLQELCSKASEADRALFQQEHIRSIMIATINDVIAKGMKGLLREIQLLNAPWGFEPKEIPHTHPICLLHGTSDATVPSSMGIELHAKILHADATFIPREGHFMLAHKLSECRRLLKEFFARPRLSKAAAPA